ncbi:hypothetical protein, partial [Niallia taxi]|uniref:hypothetical protein n=1 Tax=Niallia taxi TaxID=2499688 RepID=UPI002E24CE7D|nr:hypothetical protein [Niallia taxi]
PYLSVLSLFICTTAVTEMDKGPFLRCTFPWSTDLPEFINTVLNGLYVKRRESSSLETNEFTEL